MQNSFTRVQWTNSQSSQILHYIAINDCIDIKSGNGAGLLGVACLSDSYPVVVVYRGHATAAYAS
jgi:hypothetical protein